MKISEKHTRTKEELMSMSEKEKKKYFTKKKRYILVKSLGNSEQAIPEFYKLMDEMVSCGYMNEEQHKETMNEISDHMISFSEMSTQDIKTQVTQSIKEIFGGKK